MTLASIVRAHGDELGAVSPPQARALGAIAACRTAVLGGHHYRCDSCGYAKNMYNSCRNRHCPQCQALAQARWIQQRQADLLPVEYFHVVFTIASELHELFRLNPAVAYGLLFAAAAESLVELAATPRHLGASIGIMGILHTWTQTMAYHPHLHFVIPGGGISQDRTRWVSCRRGFFLPVRPLSILFRGKLLAAVEEALADGRMSAPDGVDPRRALKRAARKKWTVYSKPSFVGPDHVIRYLGRYTHRIAITNGRLSSLENGAVTFLYTDRRTSKKRSMTLPAVDFLRRFVSHVLPTGFVRIRYFGGLAHASRRSWLSTARELIADSSLPQLPQPTHEPPSPQTTSELILRLTGVDIAQCPRCKDGKIARIYRIDPDPTNRLPFPNERAPPT